LNKTWFWPIDWTAVNQTRDISLWFNQFKGLACWCVYHSYWAACAHCTYPLPSMRIVLWISNLNYIFERIFFSNHDKSDILSGWFSERTYPKMLRCWIYDPLSVIENCTNMKHQTLFTFLYIFQCRTCCCKIISEQECCCWYKLRYKIRVH